MSKARVIVFFVFIICVVSLLTYLNYDKIWSYFTNKEWQFADSIGKIELSNYLATCGTSSNFLIITNNSIEGYSDECKKNFEKTMTNKDVITYSNGDYSIIAQKGASKIDVLCGNEIVWSTEISNANILSAYINKNGYVAVTYSQTGYKSLIKVFSNTGAELFTSYLASTYALDVAISSDNKRLAFAEIDTNGINVESQIKIIDIKSASEGNVEKYSLDANELVTDIEFNENNNVVVMSDNGVKVLENAELTSVVDFNTENVLMADISNGKGIVTVKNEKNGLFDESISLCIYDFKDLSEPKFYGLDEAPNSIKCLKNIIAIDTGRELIFVNMSGNFVKKCEYDGQLKDIVLFDDGGTAVLIFRDSAEFIKIGGI